MEVVSHYSQTYTDEYPDGSTLDHGPVFELLVCPACQGVILRTYLWHEGMESENDTRFDVLYPSETRLPPGLPVTVEKAFISALKVKPIDSNAFAVLV